MRLTSKGREFHSSMLEGKKLEPKGLIIGSSVSGESHNYTYCQLYVSYACQLCKLAFL